VPEGTQALTWTAWRWLLLNHPHDDIYGSGIDEVHHEMAFRFSQSRQIADALVRDSVRQLARQVDYSGQDGTPVLVYNPLGWARREIAEAVIDFDFDDPKAGTFQLVDSAGQVVPHQVIEDEERFWMEVLKPNRKRQVRVLLPVQVPPFGYTTYYAQPALGKTRAAPDLKLSRNGAENRFLSFTIEADGGLTVIDKTTGQTYTGLHHFYDTEDTGDEYTYCPLPEHSQTTSTAGGQAAITQTENGPCRAAFRVEQILHLPVGLTPDRQRRSRETVPLVVVSTVRLYADQPGIFITTEIDNQACDHKLAVHFPTGLHVTQAHVDESFMVAARDLKLPPSQGWVEDPTPLMHQRTFTDLSDGSAGWRSSTRVCRRLKCPKTELSRGTCCGAWAGCRVMTCGCAVSPPGRWSPRRAPSASARTATNTRSCRTTAIGEPPTRPHTTMSRRCWPVGLTRIPAWNCAK
jgi:alpha-mannosidase